MLQTFLLAFFFAASPLTPEAALQRAEITAAAADVQQAEMAVVRELRAAPRDYPLRRLRVRLLLAQGDATAAREQAAALNREMPDDLAVYGLLAEAQARLGDLAGAEKNVQWMLDLRPEDPRSLLAAARLRTRFGLHEGALQMYADAVRRFPAEEMAARCQTLVGAAESYLALGKLAGARDAAEQALRLAPEAAAARAVMTQITTRQKKEN
ncbi:MAG: tetratricopeptide repeat protein [Bryobacterales bacterium]|nr:tetratricopeptide repeat protein [Bryobacterales bacterium]